MPKTRVSVIVLRSVGSWLQTRGPATKKARSPSLSLLTAWQGQCCWPSGLRPDQSQMQ